MVFAVILFFIIQFILIEGVIIYNANTRERVKADYMIILGAGVNGYTPSVSLYNRLFKGLEFIRNNPEIKVILSGGMGKKEKITEAEAMRRFLISNGVSRDRLIIENKSTNTYENISFTKKILKSMDGRDNLSIGIVTGGFHLFRAKLIARRLGFKAYGIAAKAAPKTLVKCYIREYFAVIKSFILDR